MKILVIGGTRFLGRHFVEAALKNNHEVTVFHRGQTNVGLFDSVEEILGDRDGGTDRLKGREWDAVVDTCGYVPRVVRQSVETLAGTTANYTFISSISVYKDFPEAGMDETTPVDVLPEDEAGSEDVSKYYGPLKALCEYEVTRGFGERALIVRPGLIVGPNDPTDRFTYWPARFDQGGDALVPGDAERLIQFIDVRDLASFTLALVEQRAGGVYHATGLPVSMAELVEACQAVSVHAAAPVWVEESFLEGTDVQPWMELPLWIGPAANWPGFMEVSVAKALERGLTCRSTLETVGDTLSWVKTGRGDREWKAGLRPEKERELLNAWRARQSS